MKDGKNTAIHELDSDDKYQQSLKDLAGKKQPVEITGYKKTTNLEVVRTVLKITSLSDPRNPIVVAPWHLSDFKKAGQAIVGLKTGKEVEATDLIDKMKLKVVRVIGEDPPTAYVVELPKEITVEDLKKIYGDGSVSYIEPNIKVRLND